MFDKSQRSTFPYWFAHWCAFQMTALNHHMWKLRYLFHDWEKPWMRLFFDYPKVQKWHRKHRKHHPEWLERKLSTCHGSFADVDYYDALYYLEFFDYEAMIIDWECSHFTKEASPRNAREELKVFLKLDHISKYPNLLSNDEYRQEFKDHCYEVLNKYNFD